ncbi:MAG: RNA polymerase sigma factor, partial [Candidatus Hydrogenedentes bacterium]|nr:RNA polymerase sigma factor [Candidatus Hydrogenedentota bacterium]
MSISSADESLLKQWFNERDADAFKAICSRHAGMVYATCLRILRNETEAEDVVQSCFESLSGLRKRPRGPLGPWLHKVATNRALDVLKSDKRRKAREEGFFVGRESHTEILWEDIYEFVDEAIEELPEKLRVALVAHFLEDETHESIARREGVSRAA